MATENTADRLNKLADMMETIGSAPAMHAKTPVIDLVVHVHHVELALAHAGRLLADMQTQLDSLQHQVDTIVGLR